MCTEQTCFPSEIIRNKRSHREKEADELLIWKSFSKERVLFIIVPWNSITKKNAKGMRGVGSCISDNCRGFEAGFLNEAIKLVNKDRKIGN